MYAQVVIDAVIGGGDKVFDYLIPEGENVCVGGRVLVPFGGRNVEGFVLGLCDTTDCPPDKLKTISKVLDEFTAIKPEFLAILDSICDKFKLRKIDVLRLFVPSTVRGRKRKRVPKNKEIKASAVDTKQITLTDEQQAVVKEVTSPNKKGSVQVFVLHGVTGSGKTEVYMHIIESVLARGQTAIMLVPEIGLTPQVLGNFRARFGETVATLHSGLSDGERYDEWFRLHSGEARIALGARSAVFAPVENVGVIIIDEEHDGSYYSESNPRFFTHEIAKLRCKYNATGCRLVLGSATPSTETFYKTTTGEYKLLTLTKRVNNQQMPQINLVDMAEELRRGNGGIFSRALAEKLQSVVANGRQAMIFLNRRGFSSFIMCRNCGWVARCSNCDVSLVWHRDDSQLKCHYCSARFTPVTKCPECGSVHLKHGATGTQKVALELENLFADVKVFRMDADNTKTKDALIAILDEFSKTRPAILVGTQMIAKGHHFPHVSLVGVVDADNSLHFSDFRASERTFALITQVAGRAGRSANAGSVLVQTYMPNHYVYRLAAAYDYRAFYDKEINTRAVTKYPPFTTIVRVLVTGERDDVIKTLLQKIMNGLKTRAKDFTWLGAMKSPLGRIQNKFRYQILMRFPRENEKELLDFVDENVKLYQAAVRNVSVFLEINPQSLS